MLNTGNAIYNSRAVGLKYHSTIERLQPDLIQSLVMKDKGMLRAHEKRFPYGIFTPYMLRTTGFVYLADTM